MHLGLIKSALEGDREELFYEAKDPLVWQKFRDDPKHAETIQSLIAEGERYLSEPIVALTYSKFKIFFESGSRKEYEKEISTRRTRLSVFTLLTLFFGEKKYIEALEDVIWAICDEFTWVTPSHIHIDEKLENGEVYHSYRQKIDLNSAMTARDLSEILYLLKDQLAPLVCERICQEVQERVLTPFGADKGMYHWEHMTNNWSAVCAGAIGSTALYMVKDNSLLTPIIGRVLMAMECYLSGFGTDGACTEGIGYWSYGFGFYVAFAQLLYQRTGGKINLFEEEKVKQIALFQHRSYLQGKYVISFSDSRRTGSYSAGLTAVLKQIYGEVQIPYEMLSPSLTHGKLLYTLRNVVWVEYPLEKDAQQSMKHYFPDAQWFISKQERISFVAKGGHNGESHNHNDVGNFILHANGTAFLDDTGTGEYTRQYFGTERYEIFCNSSRSHSVPVVEGKYQQAGSQYGAKVQKYSFSDEEDGYQVDIAGAYGNENLVSCVRTFRVQNKDQYTLYLQDEYNFLTQPSGVKECFMTFIKPEIVTDGHVCLSKNGNSVDILYDSSLLQCEIREEIFVNAEAQQELVYLIYLHVIKPTTRFKAEISFTVRSA